MLRRLAILAAMLAVAMLLASPAYAQSSLEDEIIDDVFDDVPRSPSQTTYDEPGDGGTDADLPPEVARVLCESIVHNRAIPTFMQAEIAEEFGLGCEPIGSFLDAFFNGTFFAGIFDRFSL